MANACIFHRSRYSRTNLFGDPGIFSAQLLDLYAADERDVIRLRTNYLKDEEVTCTARMFRGHRTETFLTYMDTSSSSSSIRSRITP